MKLRECSNGAADRGMERALGAKPRSRAAGTHQDAWKQAWQELGEALTAVEPDPQKRVMRYMVGVRWAEAVQKAFPKEMAAFATMTEEELDASLTLMRHEKPWAFWIAACECMLREHEKR